MMDISKYQHIADEISCADSPVGIDAKKTHVMILAKLESIERRLDSLERPARDGSSATALQHEHTLARLDEVLKLVPQAIASMTDAIDDEMAGAANRGQDIDLALRNGLTAALHFGQRISAAQLDALGTLLRSDVLHPSAVDLIGRLGQALVEACKEPRGSAGLWRTLAALRDSDIRRSMAFLLSFAQRLGAALNENQGMCTGKRAGNGGA
jgi:uncharacterized protein YjgD (DUF1641 family)